MSLSRRLIQAGTQLERDQMVSSWKFIWIMWFMNIHMSSYEFHEFGECPVLQHRGRPAEGARGRRTFVRDTVLSLNYKFHIYIYIYTYISCLILSQSGSMYFDGLRVFYGNGNWNPMGERRCHMEWFLKFHCVHAQLLWSANVLPQLALYPPRPR